MNLERAAQLAKSISTARLSEGKEGANFKDMLTNELPRGANEMRQNQNDDIPLLRRHAEDYWKTMAEREISIAFYGKGKRVAALLDKIGKKEIATLSGADHSVLEAGYAILKQLSYDADDSAAFYLRGAEGELSPETPKADPLDAAQNYDIQHRRSMDSASDYKALLVQYEEMMTALDAGPPSRGGSASRGA